MISCTKKKSLRLDGNGQLRGVQLQTPPAKPAYTNRKSKLRALLGKKNLLCSCYAVEFLNFRLTLDAMLLAVPGFI